MRGKAGRDGLTAQEVLAGTQFTLAAETDDGRLGSVWMRGAHSTFSRGGDNAIEGKARSLTLGGDYVIGRWQTGLAVSRIATKGSYTATTGKGGIRADLTGFYPYFNFRASDDLSVWGLVGYGTGSLEVDPDNLAKTKAGVKSQQVSLGVRQTIVPRTGSSDFSLVLKGDGNWLSTRSEQTATLMASKATSTRLRFGLEGSWKVQTDTESVWTPRFGLIGRYDGGDGLTGYGLEAEAGIDWADATGHLKFGLNSTALLKHETDDYRQWSVSALVSYDFNPQTTYGLSAKLEPTWKGSTTKSIDPLTDAVASAGPSESSTNSAGIQGELRYGFPGLGGLADGALSALGSMDDDSRQIGLGYSLAIRRTGAPEMEIGVTAKADRSTGRMRPKGAEFTWSIRW